MEGAAAAAAVLVVAAVAAAAEEEEEEAAEEEEEKVAVQAEGLRLHLSAKSKSGYRGVYIIGNRYQARPLATRPRPRVLGAARRARERHRQQQLDLGRSGRDRSEIRARSGRGLEEGRVGAARGGRGDRRRRCSRRSGRTG